MICFINRRAASAGLFFAAVCAATATHADHTDSAAELANLRALPFGYVARCLGEDLNIRSRNSATFVISHSELCRHAIKVRSRNGSPDPTSAGFPMCSTDPGDIDAVTQLPVPLCSTLVIPQPI